jgi:hypothetical protein
MQEAGCRRREWARASAWAAARAASPAVVSAVGVAATAVLSMSGGRIPVDRRGPDASAWWHTWLVSCRRLASVEPPQLSPLPSSTSVVDLVELDDLFDKVLNWHSSGERLNP